MTRPGGATEAMRDGNGKRPQENSEVRVPVIFYAAEDRRSPSAVGRYIPLARSLAQVGHPVQLFLLGEPEDDSIPAAPNLVIQHVGQAHVRYEGALRVRRRGFDLFASILKSMWVMFRRGMRAPRHVVVLGKPLPVNSIP